MPTLKFKSSYNNKEEIKMKRIAALMIALMLVCSFSIAMSEEVVELDRLTTTGTTSVSLTVNNSRDTYIVVIPSKVEIDPVTQYGEGTITLKSGWQLISVNGLDVKLTEAENGILDGRNTKSSSITCTEFQNFKMKSEDGNTVTYAIQPSGKYPLTAVNYTSSTFSYYKTNLITISKGGDNSIDKTCTLTFYVEKMPPAGVYSDTLTFAIITY